MGKEQTRTWRHARQPHKSLLTPGRSDCHFSSVAPRREGNLWKDLFKRVPGIPQEHALECWQAGHVELQISRSHAMQWANGGRVQQLHTPQLTDVYRILRTSHDRGLNKDTHPTYVCTYVQTHCRVSVTHIIADQRLKSQLWFVSLPRHNHSYVCTIATTKQHTRAVIRIRAEIGRNTHTHTHTHTHTQSHTHARTHTHTHIAVHRHILYKTTTMYLPRTLLPHYQLSVTV